MNVLCQVGRITLGMAAALGLLLLAAVGPAQAQDSGFVGTVVEDKAVVRAGAGDGFYAVGELSRGQQVNVAGIEFGWYKVVPPAGVASAIAKSDVQLAADGKTAKVTADSAPVFAFNTEPRPAGATAESLHWRRQTNLTKGASVEVLGTDGDYLKIAAPAGVYVYLGPAAVRRVTVAAPAPTPAAVPSAEAQAVPGLEAAAAAAVPTPAPGPAASPATQPAPTDIPLIETPAPAPAPAIQEPRTSSAFKDAEAQFTAGMKKPLEDQPIGQLLTTYQALQRDPTLLPS